MVNLEILTVDLILKCRDTELEQISILPVSRVFTSNDFFALSTHIQSYSLCITHMTESAHNLFKTSSSVVITCNFWANFDMEKLVRLFTIAKASHSLVPKSVAVRHSDCCLDRMIDLLLDGPRSICFKTISNVSHDFVNVARETQNILDTEYTYLNILMSSFRFLQLFRPHFDLTL